MELNTQPLLTLAAILVTIISVTVGQTVNIFQLNHLGPYPNGETAYLVCDVTNVEVATMIVRLTKTQSDVTTTLVDNDEVHNAAPTNVVYFNTIDQTDPISTWRIIQLTGMTEKDAGRYTCHIISTDGSTAFATASIDVQVQYVPTPMCSVLGGATTEYTYSMGDEVPLLCTSDLGVPTASLSWSVSGGPVLPASETTIGTGSIRTLVTLMITSQHNGANYFCISNSDAGNTLICQLGPFTVIDRPDTPSTLQTTQMTTTMAINAVTIKSTNAREPSLTTVSRTTSNNSSPKVSANSGLSDSAVAAICIIFILLTIAVVLTVYLVRTRRCDNLLSKRKTSHGHSNGQSGLQATGGVSSDAEHAYYNTAQDAASVQHVQSPSGGALYAVVEKPKSVRHPVTNGYVPNNNKTELSEKSLTGKTTEPVMYSNLNELSVAESPKREKSTTTTAVPCTDDSSMDGRLNLALPSSDLADGTAGNNELPVYAKVNKTMKIKKKDVDESAPSSDQEHEEYSPSKDLNVEGLLYADLQLTRPRVKTDTIISLDESTIYADIGVLTET